MNEAQFMKSIHAKVERSGIMQRHADDLADTMREIVGVDTGALRDSIHTGDGVDSAGVKFHTVSIGGGIDYWDHYENGHFTEDGSFVEGAHVVERAKAIVRGRNG